MRAGWGDRVGSGTGKGFEREEETMSGAPRKEQKKQGSRGRPGNKIRRLRRVRLPGVCEQQLGRGPCDSGGRERGLG